MGDLMSNVVPLPAALNRGPWLELEKVVSSAPEKKLALSDTFWIVAGPIFEAGEVKRRTGNGIAVPDAFFKIVAWVDRSSKFQAMAFIFPKDAVFRDPSIYLSSVNEVEVRTGIDFFHELDEDAEDDAEAFVPNCMWEMSR
jgi:endonuclease G